MGKSALEVSAAIPSFLEGRLIHLLAFLKDVKGCNISFEKGLILSPCAKN